MNKELTRKLVKRFPVLYQDFYSSMQVTCMCWGFDHGDGWFDIIWQLSLALEDELHYSWLQKQLFLRKKFLAKHWNNFIYKLSPVQRDKTKMVGKGTHEDPMRHVIVEKAKRNVIDIVFEQILLVALFFHKKKTKEIKAGSGFKYFVWYPETGHRVDQVKEKFGTLRYYCAANDRMQRLIDFADQLSGITCEVCSKYGKLRDNGWLVTLCDKCNEKQEAA